LLVTTLGCSTSAPAADWYLNKDQAAGTNWNQFADWNSASNNTGTTPAALYSTDTYRTNGKDLRTPEIAGTAVFPGAVLMVEGGSSSYVYIKSLVNGGVSVPKVVTTGGNIAHYLGTNGLQFVQTLSFENRSGQTTFEAGSGRTLRMDVGTWIGAGKTRVAGGGTVLVNATDATSYTGELFVDSGTLNFDMPFSSAGKLVVDTDAKVMLDQTVTVTGLTVAGVVKGVDTYNYSQLASEFPTNFTTGGSGSIIVRAPATWYLSTSQVSGSDWGTTTHWKANADGTGLTAPSVNPYDSYINQAPTRVLRTPTSTATFGGKELTLNGSSLVLGQNANDVSTIGMLTTAGTVGISNPATGTRGLTLTKWVANAGTITISTVSGGAIDLRMPELIGAGNLTLSGSGEVRPYVGHTKAYSGTITVNSGAKLAVQAGTPFSTGGKLVVNSGGSVVLGDWIYCTALTVNGVVKPVGTYSAATLGSGFTTTNDSKVVVYTADLVGPPLMFGVNIAGADFKDYAFWQKDPVVWDYYQSKGQMLVRLPFKWNRVQSQPYDPVDFDNLDDCIDLARARGMKVILDVHSYGSITNAAPRIGHPSHPVDWMLDLWDQLAEHYKDEPAIIGYDLMNEPFVGTGGTTSEQAAAWGEMVQQTIHVIRRHDQTHYIYVEGLFASGAQNWHPGSANNASLDVKDPVGRLIYSAHSYWDLSSYSAYNGVYDSSDVPYANIGKDSVAPFVNWLKERPYAHGHIGEYGVPKSYHTEGWKTALGVFLDYLEENNISGTYWAGGEDWGSDQLSIHPFPFPGPDKPQMEVARDFTSPPVLSDIYVDNQLSGSSVTFLPSVADWATGTTSNDPAFYGDNYQHDGGTGTKSAKFTPNIQVAGNYDVFVRWTTGPNRGSSVPVTVVHGGGTTSAGPLDMQTVQSNAVNGWNPIGTYLFNAGTGGSVTLSNTGANGHVMADAVWFRPSNAFPQGWQAGDVGSLSVAGTSSHSSGVYTLISAGTIYGTADAFHFVYKDVTGDCTLTARVGSQFNTNTYARAGVMIRDSLGANAAFADAIITPDAGGFMQHRSTAGGTVTSTGGGSAVAPYWVQIKRVGNVFTAYKSTSGTAGSWVQMGSSRTITMGSTVKVGLVACSFTTNTQSTVTVDNVTVVP
jgi:endoglucanase